MKSPKTAKEALHQCELIWEELANTGGNVAEKYNLAEAKLGYLPQLACPACEYDSMFGGTCSHCPVDAWRSGPDDRFCMDLEYRRWQDSPSIEGRKQVASQILDLIRSSEAY